jgi:WD40 repeat protein
VVPAFKPCCPEFVVLPLFVAFSNNKKSKKLGSHTFFGKPDQQFLAVATHRTVDELHSLGQPFHGDGMIQIWDFGDLTYNSIGEYPPKMVLGIMHKKAFVWDMSWCPTGSPSNYEEQSRPIPNQDPVYPRLGLLAVAFGDGTVSVYSIPHPDYLRGPAPHFINLAPSFVIDPSESSLSLISSVKWYPHGDHDLLLTGFHDGSLAVWKLDDSLEAETRTVLKAEYSLEGGGDVIKPDPDASMDQAGGAANANEEAPEQRNVLTFVPVKARSLPLMQASSTGSFIRAVSWNPYDPNTFAACAMTGDGSFWDLRSALCAPVATVPFGGNLGHCIDWFPTEAGSGCVIGTDDGSMRYYMRPDSARIMDNHPYVVWVRCLFD